MNQYFCLKDQNIADRIRYHMAEYKMTINAMAEICDCSRDLIFSYMHGHCTEENMNIQVLKKMANYFGKEKYYFCNEYLEFIDCEDVSSFLKCMRKKYGLNQRQFAKMYGIPIASYKGYESGRNRLPFEYWKRIISHSEV